MKNALNKLVDTVSKVFTSKSGDKDLRIIHLDSVDSTNNYLMNYKPETDEKITVVITDNQTAGRGQGTNHWESEPGKNLTFSILIHPTMVPLARQFLLSEMEALAIYDVLGDILGKEDVKMKWPNDIYWKDKKLCGILIENRLSGTFIRDSIIGIGLNVNQDVFLSDAPNPVSMRQILGREFNRDEVLRRILAKLNVCRCMVDFTYMRYNAMLYRRGKGFFPFRDASGDFMAEILETDRSGLLMLRKQGGEVQSYAFKEVQFII